MSADANMGALLRDVSQVADHVGNSLAVGRTVDVEWVARKLRALAEEYDGEVAG